MVGEFFNCLVHHYLSDGLAQFILRVLTRIKDLMLKNKMRAAINPKTIARGIPVAAFGCSAKMRCLTALIANGIEQPIPNNPGKLLVFTILNPL